jgi:hypothetical protein
MPQARTAAGASSPENAALIEDMRKGAYTREGTMVAFPTCFPGETAPIPLDESRITALDVIPSGVVYGGSSGRQAHLFVADTHGITGIVFDIGSPEGATECAAVCCGAARMVAFVNGPKGGRAIGAPLVNLAQQDLIQEWSLGRPALRDLGECVAGEAVTHAVADASRAIAVGVTPRHLFTVDIASGKIQPIGEVPAGGRIAAAANGVYGRDGAAHLWRFDVKTGAIARQAVPLPSGDWDLPLVWAKDPRTGTLFTADKQGRIFPFDETRGFGEPLGTAPLTPVGTMAATLDGRLFGFCGDEMAKMFCYDPATRAVTNLGVAASVIERRRYGYVFADAVTGRDGEILFAENDNGGHLWVYFPKVRG